MSINQRICNAQEEGDRPLEAVCKDLSERIGGHSESKNKLIDTAERMMNYDYVNTANPKQKYTTSDFTEEDCTMAPTNLEYNKCQIIATVRLVSDVRNTVLSGHTTPVYSPSPTSTRDNLAISRESNLPVVEQILSSNETSTKRKFSPEPSDLELNKKK